MIPLATSGRLTERLEYDDGVYYSAAAHLLNGAMPYRDVVFVHPPGIAVLLAPFTALAGLIGDTGGMALARLAFAAVGAANAWLVYRLLRRHRERWAVAGGILYAVWRLPVQAEVTLLMEPLLVLLVLLALDGLDGSTRNDRRRVLTAGILLGLAAVVKLWAIPVAVAIGYMLLRQAGPRALVHLAGGAAAAFTVVAGPFIALAPEAFVQQVVLAQLGRASPDGLSERLTRFADVAGLGGIGHVGALVPAQVQGAGALALLVGFGALAWSVPWARIHVVVAAVQCLEMVAAPVYWYHYFAFAAGSSAVVLSVGIGRLPARPRLWVPGLLACSGMVLGLSAVRHPLQPYPAYADVRSFAREHSCVWFDSASAAVAADALSRQVAAGCPAPVDDYGVLLSAGTPVSYQPLQAVRRSPVLQASIVADLSRSDAAVTPALASAGFGTTARMTLERDFELVDDRGPLLWVRRIP